MSLSFNKTIAIYVPIEIFQQIITINQNYRENKMSTQYRNCQIFWKAVLIQQFMDAFSKAEGNTSSMNRISAREWLRKRDKWFCQICEFAGYNHKYVEERIDMLFKNERKDGIYFCLRTRIKNSRKEINEKSKRKNVNLNSYSKLAAHYTKSL